MNNFASVNLSRLVENCLAVQNELTRQSGGANKSTAVCAVVKANAYGHGAARVSQTLFRQCNVNFFAVASFAEGLTVKKSLRGAAVLVLLPLFGEELKKAVLCEFILSVSSLLQLSQAIIAAKQANKKSLVHIALNSGMNRLGVYCEKELIKILQYAKSNRQFVEIQGAYTHFHSCLPYVFAQSRQRFFRLFGMVKAVFPQAVSHASASMPFECFGGLGLDYIRVGLLLYGFNQGGKAEKSLCVLPILSANARVLCVNEVKKGGFISYNSDFRAKSAMKIATIAFGYADGLPRAFSQKGGASVFLGGSYCKTVGNICMDMSIVDISNAPKPINCGDFATVYSDESDSPNSILCASGILQTIPYELLTGIGTRVLRKYTCLQKPNYEKEYACN